MRTVCLALLLMTLAPRVLADDRAAISLLLDHFHAAAANADYDGYFSLFTTDGVFLGTDASERWTVDEFRRYAKPSFDAGRGWRYIKQERHVMTGDDGKTGWFDEILLNARLGRCRGTGVVRLVDGQWKVAHYSLTLLIPNSLAEEVGAKTLLEDHIEP